MKRVILTIIFLLLIIFSGNSNQPGSNITSLANFELVPTVLAIPDCGRDFIGSYWCESRGECVGILESCPKPPPTRQCVQSRSGDYQAYGQCSSTICSRRTFYKNRDANCIGPDSIVAEDTSCQYTYQCTPPQPANPQPPAQACTNGCATANYFPTGYNYGATNSCNASWGCYGTGGAACPNDPSRRLQDGCGGDYSQSTYGPPDGVRYSQSSYGPGCQYAPADWVDGVCKRVCTNKVGSDQTVPNTSCPKIPTDLQLSINGSYSDEPFKPDDHIGISAKIFPQIASDTDKEKSGCPVTQKGVNLSIDGHPLTGAKLVEPNTGEETSDPLACQTVSLDLSTLEDNTEHTISGNFEGDGSLGGSQDSISFTISKKDKIQTEILAQINGGNSTTVAPDDKNFTLTAFVYPHLNEPPQGRTWAEYPDPYQDCIPYLKGIKVQLFKVGSSIPVFEQEVNNCAAADLSSLKLEPKSQYQLKAEFDPDENSAYSGSHSEGETTLAVSDQKPINTFTKIKTIIRDRVNQIFSQKINPKSNVAGVTKTIAQASGGDASSTITVEASVFEASAPTDLSKIRYVAVDARCVDNETGHTQTEATRIIPNGQETTFDISDDCAALGHQAADFFHITAKPADDTDINGDPITSSEASENFPISYPGDPGTQPTQEELNNMPPDLSIIPHPSDHSVTFRVRDDKSLAGGVFHIEINGQNFDRVGQECETDDKCLETSEYDVSDEHFAVEFCTASNICTDKQYYNAETHDVSTEPPASESQQEGTSGETCQLLDQNGQELATPFTLTITEDQTYTKVCHTGDQETHREQITIHVTPEQPGPSEEPAATAQPGEGGEGGSGGSGGGGEQGTGGEGGSGGGDEGGGDNGQSCNDLLDTIFFWDGDTCHPGEGGEGGEGGSGSGTTQCQPISDDTLNQYSAMDCVPGTNEMEYSCNSNPNQEDRYYSDECQQRLDEEQDGGGGGGGGEEPQCQYESDYTEPVSDCIGYTGLMTFMCPAYGTEWDLPNSSCPTEPPDNGGGECNDGCFVPGGGGIPGEGGGNNYSESSYYDESSYYEESSYEPEEAGYNEE